MICVPIVASTHAKAIEQIGVCAGIPVDMIELRLDLLEEKVDLAGLLRAAKQRVIVTCRPERAGGRWSGMEQERLELLQSAVRMGVAYVDVEDDSVNQVQGTDATGIICSYHDFKATPENLGEIVTRMENEMCDVVKFATMATSLEDNLRVFAVLAKCRKPAIGLCMGELGEISRILALRYGSLLTFGTLAAGLESAPGQLVATDLANLYRVSKLSKDTAIYGVVGDPISHSMSPEIHNTAFARLGIDAVYLRFRVQEFSSFMNTVVPELGIRGLSVTIPHKHSAMKLAGHCTLLAQKIGAVNTLTLENGDWHGENTDCEAAIDAIKAAAQRAGITMRGARALLLGAGGTARAVGFGLVNAGCSLTIANRTRSRAEALAKDILAGVMSLDSVAGHQWDIIANTTSVGMHPRVDATPIEDRVFHARMVVFDAVYNPLATRMLEHARKCGAEIANGLEMFTGQAARQFERWTGQDAPLAAMREVVERRLQKG